MIKFLNNGLSKIKFTTLLLAITLCLCSKFSWSQQSNPLDSIAAEKRVALKNFSYNISLLSLSKKIIKIYQQEMKTDQDFFAMKDEEGKLYRVKKEVLSIVNAEEYNNYLLAYYSKYLTQQNLIDINKLFKTSKGLKLKKVLKDSMDNDVSPESSDLETFMNNESSIRYITVADQLYDQIEFLLLKYFKDKAEVYEAP